MSGAARHARVSEILLDALDAPPEARAALVERACAGDAEFREDVEALLREHDAAAGFLETPALGAPLDLEALAADAPGEEPPPAELGGYRILRKLGEGGMGVVWLAGQRNPPRPVALKLVRPGRMSPETGRRLALEARLLARLRHPGIAQVYEAGEFATAAGPRPYFAMELVDGRPLLDAARALGLDLAARVRLLAGIADAVQHAHQQGVIHRDLKPDNILVTAEGRPKILDFGVARALEPEAGFTTLDTDGGRVLGTLAYMSPEQIAGAGADTHCDVHALGVIGYELLGGARPYDLEGKPAAEAARIVRDEEPARLSALDPALAGDLDLVLGKAVEKDRERRYATAAALAEDLRRHLADEPVLARPPSAAYHFRKFVRRHRALVAGVVLAMLALGLGVAATTWQTLAAFRERDRARRAEALAEGRLASARVEREAAEAVTYFLTRLLASSDPGEYGKDVSVADVLVRAGDGLAGVFAGRPAVEAGVREALGTCWMGLGLPREALPHFEEEVRLRAAAHGDDDPRTLKAMSNRALALKGSGRAAEAVAAGRAVVEAQRRALGPAHEDTLTAALNLAVACEETGQVEESVRILEEVVAAAGTEPGSAHRLRLLWSARQRRAAIGTAPGRAAGAERELRAVLEAQARELGAGHPDALATVNALGLAIAAQGRAGEAKSVLAAALSRARARLGDGHVEVCRLAANLAPVLVDLGEAAEAEELLLLAYDGWLAALGPSAERTRGAAARLAGLAARSGRTDEAATWNVRAAAATAPGK